MGGAAYLAAALGAAKVVSAVFRLALTNVLGAEGLGLYQLAFPVYSLLVTVTATCMSVAVSRLVAEKAASDGIGREYLLPGIVLAALPSVLLGAAVLLCSDKIAAVQGNSAVQTGYFAIIPAVIFVAVGSVFKGWFQGRFNLVPTAFSGVFSQAEVAISVVKPCAFNTLTTKNVSINPEIGNMTLPSIIGNTVLKSSL